MNANDNDKYDDIIMIVTSDFVVGSPFAVPPFQGQSTFEHFLPRCREEVLGTCVGGGFKGGGFKNM